MPLQACHHLFLGVEFADPVHVEPGSTAILLPLPNQGMLLLSQLRQAAIVLQEGLLAFIGGLRQAGDKVLLVPL